MSEKKNRAAEEKEQAAAAAEPVENTEESAVETPVEEAASAPEPDPALVKAQQEAAEYKDKWIRSVAEFENFRKRNADTRHTSYMEGRADIIVKVLPIGDNLERALATCDEKTKKGIEMVLRSFKALLEGEGIEEINPVGEEFDPKLCEAIMSEPAAEGIEPGYVKEVFLKGYKKGDKVLRFAQVKVTT